MLALQLLLQRRHFLARLLQVPQRRIPFTGNRTGTLTQLLVIITHLLKFLLTLMLLPVRFLLLLCQTLCQLFQFLAQRTIPVICGSLGLLQAVLQGGEFALSSLFFIFQRGETLRTVRQCQSRLVQFLLQTRLVLLITAHLALDLLVTDP